MGYRSDIGLALTKEGADRLQEKLNSLDKSSDTFSKVTTLLEYAHKHQKHEESGAELLLWDYLKWYDSFPEIRFFENLMGELEWDDFLFLRIGEDMNDNEEKGNFWDNPFELTILRTITSICNRTGTPHAQRTQVSPKREENWFILQNKINFLQKLLCALCVWCDCAE